jgi:hypothetical protein
VRFIICRAVLLCVTLCVTQGATAQPYLRFWTAGGDHGIAACLFQATLTIAPGDRGVQHLDFGVSADPGKPDLIGKVRLRQAGMPSGPRLVEIGTGPRSLLSLTLRPRDADTAIADVPGDAMAVVLRSLVPHVQVWMRIADGTGQHGQPVTLSVDGGAKDVSSCLSVLQRDLASQEADSGSRFRTNYSPVLFDW